MPSKTTGREFPERPLIGVGAVVLSDSGVLLIKRSKPPRIGQWSLPGGAQRLGETVFDTARREILEETGLNVEIVGLVDVVDSITHAEDGRIQFHYTLIDVLAAAEAGSIPVAGGDAAAAEWVALADLAARGLWDETTRIIVKAEAIWREDQIRA